jgi:non-reducing end alpha-L-arabinofuranosidase
MILRDAKGLVVDGLNYGGVVDPWLSEGHQGLNRANGNFVQAPAGGNRGRFGMPAGPTASPDLSSGRYPDGSDSDDNRADFRIQRSTNIASDAIIGEDNIKVSNVFGLKEGQTILIGSGNTRESVTISSVGTAGATSLASNASAGSKKLLVSSSQNFSAGQNIIVGNGDNAEDVQIAAIAAARRGFFFGGMNRNTPTPPDTIILASPIRKSYKMGSVMSGTGVNLSVPLTMDHKSGDILVSSIPSPGKVNRY